MEPLVGRFSATSRLPQYLEEGSQSASFASALLCGGANKLDHRDVDGGEGARSVHFVGAHSVGRLLHRGLGVRRGERR
jgi:hypothetical protein